MQKITKKEFIETLCAGESYFVGVNRNNDLKMIQEHCSIANAETYKNQIQSRTVEKRQSNALQFSGGSWIYFDGSAKKTFYRENDFLIMTEEWHDDFDDADFIKSMIYVV